MTLRTMDIDPSIDTVDRRETARMLNRLRKVKNTLRKNGKYLMDKKVFRVKDGD